MESDFEKKLRNLQRRIGRYSLSAYLFVFESLEFTIQGLGKEKEVGSARHITGKELLGGIRKLASVQFGPLARSVFNQWGVHSTEDFGEIVFELVGEDLLKKRESDTKEDFANGFDFEETFVRNYRIDVSSSHLE